MQIEVKTCLPNEEVALGIYLVHMIINCSSESLFSKLKHINTDINDTGLS